MPDRTKDRDKHNRDGDTQETSLPEISDTPIIAADNIPNDEFDPDQGRLFDVSSGEETFEELKRQIEPFLDGIFSAPYIECRHDVLRATPILRDLEEDLTKMTFWYKITHPCQWWKLKMMIFDVQCGSDGDRRFNWNWNCRSPLGFGGGIVAATEEMNRHYDDLAKLFCNWPERLAKFVDLVDKYCAKLIEKEIAEEKARIEGQKQIDEESRKLVNQVAINELREQINKIAV
ncbi:MAG: hypothetical protein WC797_01585 [Candidatus Paceibacterota bacterium]|jgi:hypothetical protein